MMDKTVNINSWQLIRWLIVLKLRLFMMVDKMANGGEQAE